MKNPYFSLPGVSNSILDWVLPESGGSPDAYKYFMENPPQDSDSDSIRVGVAAHKFIQYLEKAIMTTLVMPGPTAKAVADLLMRDELVKEMTPFHSKQIIDACNAVGYYNHWKEPTRINKILEECTEYFNTSRKATEETSLMSPDVAKVVDVITNVIRNKALRIMEPEMVYPKGAEIRKEEVLRFTMGGVQCKALVDRLIIDAAAKVIYIEDLKTIGIPLDEYEGYTMPTPLGDEQIRGEMYNRQVHRQMAFYMMGAKRVFPGYTIMPARILAVETKPPYRYKEIQLSTEWLHVGEQRVDHGLNEIANLGETT